VTASSRPAVGTRAYYRGSWVNAPQGEPTIYWYEVDHEGNALRQIEMYPDGRAEADDIARYPGGVSDFGFGTLHGADFYAQPFLWPTADDAEQSVMLDASALEFEAVWAKVATP
jgi:hypothetical protein